MINELEKIVKEVGTMISNWRDRGVRHEYKDLEKFKASADLMAHRALVERLNRLTPTDPIISEEDPQSHKSKRPEHYWIIDPIDGTASFGEGYPGFVTQIARINRDQVIMAAIYAPISKSSYVAQRGHGAFLNGLRLSIKGAFPPRVLIDNYPEPRGIAQQAYADLHFDGYIECGSIGLKICKVADGTADLFVKDVVLRDWDLAAPQLILEEAGGAIVDIDGKKIRYAGDYEQKGLIAASDPESIAMFLNWHKSIKDH